MDGAPARLGRYRLLRQLAVGGMAEVYLAVAEGLGDFAKQVVLKRMLPQHAREQDLVAMFVDEARLLARLRHPNIAEVYDIGQDGQDIFIALEHVEGCDLREILRAAPGGLPLDEALWVVCQLCAGLHHAHELTEELPDGTRRALGIVHRDVSPSNVLCGCDGRVKLIDFGVAKWSAQRSETRHGTVKGKLHYLSPEQCRAGPVDRRSDVFAVGVLLYELTTGQRPHRGESDFDVLAAVMEGRSTPPSQLRADYPPELEAIVLRALALAPEDRYPDAQALAGALQELARARGLVPSPAGLAARVQALAAAQARAPGAAAIALAASDVRAARADAPADVTAAASGVAPPLSGGERTRTEVPAAGAPAPPPSSAVASSSAAAASSASPASPAAAPGRPAPAPVEARTRSAIRRRRRRVTWLAAGTAAAALLVAAVVTALAVRPGGDAETAAVPAAGAARRVPRTGDGASQTEVGVRGADEARAGPGSSGVGISAAAPGSTAAVRTAARQTVPMRVPLRRREDPAAVTVPAAAPRDERAPGGVGAAIEVAAPAAPALPTEPPADAPPARAKVWDPDSPIPP